MAAVLMHCGKVFMQLKESSSYHCLRDMVFYDHLVNAVASYELMYGPGPCGMTLCITVVLEDNLP